jgi:hypothetical protein
MTGVRRHAILLMTLALTALTALAADEKPVPDSVTKIASFEGKLPEGLKTHNARAEHIRGVAAEGTGSLRITTPEVQQGRRHVRILLPRGVDLSGCDRLVCQLRARAPGAREVRLRWSAIDADDWIIFQRRFEITPGQEWIRLEQPLHLWRWGNLRVGDWSQVRSIVLQIESPVTSVEMDELGAMVGRRGRKSALPTTAWHQRIAFTGRNSRSLQRGDFFVATDATYEMTEQDLAVVIGRMEKIDAWVKRTFGKAVHPVLDGQPMAVLIFRRSREYQTFFRTLGEAWRVHIEAPDSQGYTVQDICASTYDHKRGTDRPVHFHELVHCVVTRRLRLLTSAAGHSWLHEGMGNYLQLCMYPDSLDVSVYAKNFAAPIPRDGSGLFVPLADVLTRRAGLDDYAQLASVVGYLASKKPALLVQFSVGLREGKTTEAILKAAETSFTLLEAEWFAWGKKTYAAGAKRPRGWGRHFPVPKEWLSE